MFKETYAFDDVLLQPKFSTIRSRLDVSTDTIVGKVKLSVPIIASPMDTITEARMAIKLGQLGGMGIIHRFMPITEQKQNIRKVLEARQDLGEFIPVAFAIGASEEEKERHSKLKKEFHSEYDLICIDIANGHSVIASDMLKYVKDNEEDNVTIMTGNVATAEGYQYLIDNGADCVRVGIGSGKICKTRIVTSQGIPLLTSLLDIKAMNPKQGTVLSDGGHKNPGDLVKAIAAGADGIISGSIFSGCEETPGDIFEINGIKHKKYRGMASSEVQLERKGYMKKGTAAEGTQTYVPVRGSIEEVVDYFTGGLRSGMTYQNTKTLEELKRDPIFVKITNAGLEESHSYGTKK
jgi:IMP dehydrogenase